MFSRGLQVQIIRVFERALAPRFISVWLAGCLHMGYFHDHRTHQEASPG